MAASAWELYNLAKQKIGNGTIKLGVDGFRMQLHKGSSNASTLTLNVAGDVSEQVNTGGYTAGGKTLAGNTWISYGSARQYSFDSSDVIFSATGTNMTSIQYAVVRNTGAALHLLMKSKLSTAVFTVNVGNTLTVQINVAGYFTLF
jgi:hypothetical protein